MHVIFIILSFLFIMNSIHLIQNKNTAVKHFIFLQAIQIPYFAFHYVRYKIVCGLILFLGLEDGSLYVLAGLPQMELGISLYPIEADSLIGINVLPIFLIIISLFYNKSRQQNRNSSSLPSE